MDIFHGVALCIYFLLFLVSGVCSAPNILHLDWLLASYDQNWQFLLLHDRAAKSNYNI